MRTGKGGINRCLSSEATRLSDVSQTPRAYCTEPLRCTSCRFCISYSSITETGVSTRTNHSNKKQRSIAKQQLSISVLKILAVQYSYEQHLQHWNAQLLTTSTHHLHACHCFGDYCMLPANSGKIWTLELNTLQNSSEFRVILFCERVILKVKVLGTPVEYRTCKRYIYEEKIKKRSCDIEKVLKTHICKCDKRGIELHT